MKPESSESMQVFKKKLKIINNCKNEKEFSEQINQNDSFKKELLRAKNPELRKLRKSQITDKCNQHIKSSVKSNFLWGMAFVGMLLLCIPACQPVGLIIVGIASGLYLADNINRRTNISGKISNCFFGSSKKETLEEAEKRIKEKDNSESLNLNTNYPHF